jgi:probable addiction module antidote protein
MGSVKGFLTFDEAKYLDSDEMIAAYLSEVLKGGDASEFANAVGIVARAKGMTSIANATGMSRESLYKALSQNGNPSLKTAVAVLESLGVEFAVRSKSQTQGAKRQSSARAAAKKTRKKVA